MSAHDTVDHGEAYAGATFPFCREERLEASLLNFWRHAYAVIAHFNAQPLVVEVATCSYCPARGQGIDGIQNKIHPGEPMDKDLYDLPPEELAEVPTVATSLREALDALAADKEFLTKGGVFTEDQIDSYIKIKMEEVQAYDMAPHPIEFAMYYSV